MTINVDPDSLAADGTALADWQPGVSAPGVEPASAHSTSQGVAAHFTAHSVSLGLAINHAQQVRAEGGAATIHTAASLRAQDEAGANIIAGNGSASGAVSAPMTPASVSAPVLPAIPPMPPLATMTGEAHANALHTGPGAQSLRDLADYWQSQAATLENTAAAMAQTSASVDANWIDGVQTAGANIAAHGTYLSQLAGHALALSSGANAAADNHDQTVAATPTPQEFTDAHNRLTQVVRANQASHGLLSAQVSAAAAHLAQLQAQATEAATAHHVASSATTSATPVQPGTAPSIANGSGDASSACQCGTGNASQTTGALGSGQLASNPLAAAATNAGAGSSNSMMNSMLPMMEMLPMMAMMPMSALSGLGGMSQQRTPSTMAGNAAGWSGDAALDAGMSGDLGDTLPAAGGGGGGGVAEAATAQALPAGNPSAGSPTAVSGPAASVSLPAETAGTAPAAASGGGMGAYPPMMGGGMGAGDSGGRDMRLFPDRRMVWRPVPNTEAVFGELKRERRPRAKREAREEREEGTGER
jgi:PPE family